MFFEEDDLSFSQIHFFLKSIHWIFFRWDRKIFLKIFDIEKSKKVGFQLIFSKNRKIEKSWISIEIFQKSKIRKSWISKIFKNIFQIDAKLFLVDGFSKIRMRSEAKMFLRPYVPIPHHFYRKKAAPEASRHPREPTYNICI